MQAPVEEVLQRAPAHPPSLGPHALRLGTEDSFPKLVPGPGGGLVAIETGLLICGYNALTLSANLTLVVGTTHIAALTGQGRLQIARRGEVEGLSLGGIELALGEDSVASGIGGQVILAGAKNALLSGTTDSNNTLQLLSVTSDADLTGASIK
jgi:hypothetical protein